MKTQVDKAVETKSKAVANTAAATHEAGESKVLFEDNRPEVVAQKQLAEKADNSPQAGRIAKLQAVADGSAAETIQRQGLDEEEPLQGKYEAIQNKGSEKEEIQTKSATVQKKDEKPANNTGLPDTLKSGIENLSGLSLDDVKVYYNSAKPAQVQSHAFAQGTDIHMAPGQEKHLPHEAWHVVQQKQGRVQPTRQRKGKVNVNDDAGLEKEADFMGGRALQGRRIEKKSLVFSIHSPNSGALQRAFNPDGKEYKDDKDPKIEKINESSFRATLNSIAYPREASVVAADAQGGGSSTSSLIPQDMNTWGKMGLLKDASKPETENMVTKMHLINSHLYGPNNTDNLVLGTASANDYHSDLVEEPIKKFVGKTSGETRYAKYIVTPEFNISDDHFNIALAMEKVKVGSLDKAKYEEFKNWAKQALPSKLECKATYYKKSSDEKWTKSSAEDSHNVPMDTVKYKKKGGYREAKKDNDPHGIKGRNLDMRKLLKQPLVAGIVDVLETSGRPLTPKEILGMLNEKEIKATEKGVLNKLAQLKKRQLLRQRDGEWSKSNNVIWNNKKNANKVSTEVTIKNFLGPVEDEEMVETTSEEMGVKGMDLSTGE